jgi:hypothetical protein
MNDTASAAASYVARGWAVLQLHDVTGGACSCGSDDEPRHSASQGGKHPLGRGWQNAGITDVTAVRDAWARRPGANIGIVTGRASGIWVLDVDPEHGGDEKLAALVGAYGPLPETWTVQTGSGGRHYYWTMPDFDFTTSRGQLPVGLDVRGNSGQVVAPPSYTLKGPYRVLVPAPVVQGPGWLLSMIRPSAREMAEIGSASQRPGELVSSLDGGSSNLGRGSDYALAAVRALLAELAGALPGSRNDTAYRVGRRLAELVNSPWSGLDADAVLAGYMAAALACDVDGAFSQTEAEQVLRKAIYAQGGRGAPLPAADFYGSLFAPAPAVFPPGMVPPGNVDASGNGGSPVDFDQAGQGPALNPFSSPGGVTSANVAAPLINGPIEQGEILDPWEDAVARELSRLLVREEAARRAKARAAVTTDFDQVALDDAGMDQLPEAIPLVAGWLEMDSLARINGPSGHGKSFVVLDFGACVSTGTAWHGQKVTQTSVCYVVAEGVRGTAKRARAWCRRHGLDSTGITFVPRPVQVGGMEWEAFKAWCVAKRFGLVIFDTQARSTVGVDENDSTEMGQIVASLDEIRAITGACCMLVHHRGLRGDQGRGSSAVRGAMETELDVTRQGTTITLRSTKQKDGSDPAPVLFTMNSLDDSIVLIAETDAISVNGPFISPAPVVMTKRQKCSIEIARALMDAPGLTPAQAKLHARVAMGLEVNDTTRRVLDRAWSDLEQLGRLAKATGRQAYFFVELDGAAILDANPDKAVSDGPEVHVP